MTATRWFRFALLAMMLVPFGRSAAETPADHASADASIVLVLQTQVEAWNRGDIDAFMQTYAPVEDLRFASGGTVTYG